MTSDQVNYWKNVEQARANRESERLRALELAENKRANTAREQENYRSNLARESENEKSRLANYAVNARNAATNERNAFISSERQRVEEGNLARVYSLNTSTLAETQRANEARERENLRSNVANENAKISELNLRSRQQQETERANRASEANTVRGQNFQLIGNLARSVGSLGSTLKLIKGGISYGK